MNLTALLFTGVMPIVFFGIWAIYRSQARRGASPLPTAPAHIAVVTYSGRYHSGRRAARRQSAVRSALASRCGGASGGGVHIIH